MQPQCRDPFGLPHNVALHILHYAGKTNWSQLACVSKRWNRIVKDQRSKVGSATFCFNPKHTSYISHAFHSFWRGQSGRIYSYILYNAYVSCIKELTLSSTPLITPASGQESDVLYCDLSSLTKLHIKRSFLSECDGTFSGQSLSNLSTALIQSKNLLHVEWEGPSVNGMLCEIVLDIHNVNLSQTCYGLQGDKSLSKNITISSNSVKRLLIFCWDCQS
jgi:hypothetical protein